MSGRVDLAVGNGGGDMEIVGLDWGSLILVDLIQCVDTTS